MVLDDIMTHVVHGMIYSVHYTCIYIIYRERLYNTQEKLHICIYTVRISSLYNIIIM